MKVKLLCEIVGGPHCGSALLLDIECSGVRMLHTLDRIEALGHEYKFENKFWRIPENEVETTRPGEFVVGAKILW